MQYAIVSINRVLHCVDVSGARDTVTFRIPYAYYVVLVSYWHGELLYV